MATAISNWVELASISGNLTEDYYLVNDLDSSTSGYSGIGDNWQPISGAFGGSLNGSGYSISDLIMTGSSEDQNGLFKYINGGTVQNLAILDISLLSTHSRTGAIAGITSSSSIIENCYVTGKLSGYTETGGVVGFVWQGTKISNCYSSVDVFGRNESGSVGGFVGNISNVTGNQIFNCFCIGSVDATYAHGGFAGQIGGENVEISGCGWYNFSGNPDYAIGTDTGYTLDYEESDASVFYTHNHPVYTGWSFTGSSPTWFEISGSTPVLASDSGSAIWNIYNWTDLADISNKLDYTCVLQNNISSATTDYVGLGDSWVPIYNGTSYFSGVFSGQGYTISNLRSTWDSGYGYFGFFRQLDGATIEKVGFEDVIFTPIHAQGVGVVAGYMGTDTTISNCYCEGSLTGMSYAGGIVGTIVSYTNFINSYANVNVHTTTSNSAGLIGRMPGNYNEIINCFAAGDATSVGQSGGLISEGGNPGTNNIENCGWYSSSTTEAIYAWANLSGSVTYETTDISDFYSHNYGVYTGWTFTGSSPIWFEHVDSLPTFETSNYWTIWNWTDMQDMNNKLSYSGYLQNDLSSATTDYSGIGDDWEAIGHTNSPTYFTGYFNGQNNSIRDLVCYMGASRWGFFGSIDTGAYVENLAIKDSYYRDSIGLQYFGIFVGRLAGAVKNCYTQNIHIKGYTRVGGFAGYCTGTADAENCYSDCLVLSDGYSVGGFAGYISNGTNITNCFSTSEVLITGGSGINFGGFAGEDFGGVITNCGWYSSTTTDAIYAIGNTSGSVTYETTDNTDFYTHNYEFYTGWTFTGSSPVWYETQNNLPTLQSSLYWTVHNWTDLTELENKLSYSAYLQNNISSATTDYVGIGDDFTPIGRSDPYFNGVFDGEGNSISDIIINYNSSDVGLIGRIIGGTVKHLGIKNIDITQTSNSDGRVGGLAGGAGGSSTVENCFIEGQIDAYGNAVGGLIGQASYTDGVTINNCYTNVNILNGATGIGGVIGIVGSSDVSVNNTYTVGAVTGTTHVGAFIGLRNAFASYSNCGWYNFSGNPDSGFGSAPTDDSVDTWSSNTLSDFYPHNYGVYSAWTFTGSSPVWYESLTALPTLTPSTNWYIYNWTDLQDLNNKLSYSAYLQNNISSATTDYVGIGDDFTPIGGLDHGLFLGIFNGNDYTVSDLIINSTSDRVGLIGQTNETISNVGLINPNITTTSGRYCGGIVGYIGTGGYVTKCFVSGGSITANQGTVGGIAGTNYSSLRIDNCYADCIVRGPASVGGIVGTAGELRNCYFAGTVQRTWGSNSTFGGIVGTLNYNNMYNCFSVGDIDGGSYPDRCGGIAGTFVGASFIHCGWYSSSTTDAVYALGSSSGSVTYETTTESDFYDSGYGPYTGGSYTWDFSTPIWYEWTNDLPKFTEQGIITGPIYLEYARILTIS